MDCRGRKNTGTKMFHVKHFRRVFKPREICYNKTNKKETGNDVMNSERRRITCRQFEEERALYHLSDAEILHCTFAGATDGESALKEARQITVSDSTFALRYPLWHVRKLSLDHCRFQETARAALWYCEQGSLESCELHGIKALRECHDFRIAHSIIDSEEFGWKCKNIRMTDCKLRSEYLFFDSWNIELQQIAMTGKYSFQYIDGLTIRQSQLDAKDAFWHSKNVVVRDSAIKGEYLGWYSEGLTLINCTIEGTQPFCYCKNLQLMNCRMQGCDLSFEYSDVQASVIGKIDSVKNPLSGIIVADEVGAVLMEDAVISCSGKVELRSKKSADSSK